MKKKSLLWISMGAFVPFLLAGCSTVTPLQGPTPTVAPEPQQAPESSPFIQTAPVSTPDSGSSVVSSLTESELPGNTLFDVNYFDVKPQYNSNLVQFAREYQDVGSHQMVYVTGYTDSTGPLAFNIKLSQNRAQAVANILTANGISAQQVVVAYEGPSYPVGDNSTVEGRQLNRRTTVEFTPFSTTP